MSKLKELSQYKNTIIFRLLENDNLVKLINYNTADALDKPIIGDEKYDLIYKNIFPYTFTFKENTEASSFITMKSGRFRGIGGNYFKEGFITFIVLCHKDIIRTSPESSSNGALRYDLIAQEIDDSFNGSRGEWIGKMEFYEMDEIPVKDNYGGIYLTYKVLNFN